MNADLEQLNRDLPFRDDDRFAHGLDNFVYAAGLLGLVKRFIWVCPGDASSIGTRELARQLLWRLALVPGHGREILGSLREESHGASAQIGGLRLEVTTLDRLASVPGLEGAQLDIDFDYFVADTGPLERDPAQAAKLLAALSLTELPVTLTLSISSGFCPPEVRDAALKLVRDMGQRVALVGGARHSAKQTMQVLNDKGELSTSRICELWTTELQPLGGPGHSARALLSIQAKDFSDARDHYDCARELGDRADWVAYKLGLEAMGCQRYSEAATWFGRLSQHPTDSMATHALLLRAICALRANDYESCERVTRQVIAHAPLLFGVYTLTDWLGERLDRSSLPDDFETLRSRVKQVHAELSS
ncbi:MAG: hypothetical protein ABI895_34820 [Deltaproteobacteria bacterium]